MGIDGTKPFEGKTALVTGGSRGIGRAIVTRLARDGARVVFTYRQNRDAAEELAQQFPGTVPVQADQEDLASLRAMFDPVRDGLDILVNNAAINLPAPLAAITAEEFDRVTTVNAKFPLLAIREAVTILRDNGRIINISTLNTRGSGPWHGALLCQQGRARAGDRCRGSGTRVPGHHGQHRLLRCHRYRHAPGHQPAGGLGPDRGADRTAADRLAR